MYQFRSLVQWIECHASNLEMWVRFLQDRPCYKYRMKYSHPFPLRCYKLLAAFTEKYMEPYNTEPVYMVKVTLPDRVKQLLDAELVGLGLSRSVGTVAFKRNTAPEFDPVKYTHVDYDDRTDTVTNASIIVPVSGCEHTRMFWVDGDYTLTKSHDRSGNSRMDVTWHAPGQVVYEEEITEPTLVRVDTPHGAYSRQDGTYRLILSVRLEQNETFDSVVNLL